jgi:hypothetical protein
VHSPDGAPRSPDGAPARPETGFPGTVDGVQADPDGCCENLEVPAGRISQPR